MIWKNRLTESQQVKLSLLQRCFLGSVLVHAAGFLILQQLLDGAKWRPDADTIEPPTLTLLMVSPNADLDSRAVEPASSTSASIDETPEKTDPATAESGASKVPQNTVQTAEPSAALEPELNPSLSADDLRASPSRQTRSSTAVTSIAQRQEKAVKTPGTRVLMNPGYSKSPKPRYPLSAVRRHQEGIVLLRVRVSTQGEPLQIEVLQSSGVRALDEAAVQAVRNWEFTPARIGTQAVESEIQVPIQFKLD